MRMRGESDAGRSPKGSPSSTHDEGPPTRASLVVSGWTALSRVSGVLRVVAVGAILGPTHLGNAYQLTNSLPNLVYYGFLAGSLVSSILVPVLVRALQSSGLARTRSVANGFLGVMVCSCAVVAPIAVLALPPLLQLASVGEVPAGSEDQVQLVRILVLLTVPQIFGYAVIGSAGAVMMARRRFALPSAGPVVENVGVIGVLLAFWAGAGSAVTAPQDVGTGHLVLLGLGSTAAVAANASLQWWGAQRAGLALVPTAGWRDPEVRDLLRRTSHAVAQAALLATQILLILLLSSRIAGGTVALQVALHFYALPIALVATPLGLALLPELSSHAGGNRTAAFQRTLSQGLSLGLFMVIPAAVGCVLLSRPIANVVASGQMGTASGAVMIAGALSALALGLIGQTVFFILTQACYATGNTAVPLRCMAIQAAVCLVLGACAVAMTQGPSLVHAVAGAYAVASLVGGGCLLVRTVPVSVRKALAWTGRAVAAVVVMVPSVLSVTALAEAAIPGRGGSIAALIAGSMVGVTVFVGVQALFRASELRWLRTGLSSSGRADHLEDRW